MFDKVCLPQLGKVEGQGQVDMFCRPLVSAILGMPSASI
jgi:hypothetical protein